MNMARKFQKPIITAVSGVFGGVIFGTIISLIVAIFVKKEGNPLIDTPEVK
jgi:predicted membrane protein